MMRSVLVLVVTAVGVAGCGGFGGNGGAASTNTFVLPNGALVWYAAGLVVDGVDSSAIFKRREITEIPGRSTVVIDARVDRPSRVEPGAILTSCEPRSRWL
jgi:hypothetical protein